MRKYFAQSVVKTLVKPFATVISVILLLLGQHSMAATVDGILTSADEYQASYIVPLFLEKPNSQEYDKKTGDPKGHHMDADLDGFEAVLRLGWQSPNATDKGDLFMMFMLPTEIQDLTYGDADHRSKGWRTAVDGSNQGRYDKVQGSEHFYFSINDKKVKIKFDDNGKNDKRTGHKIDGNKNNNVVSASTSLTWNMENYLESNPEWFTKDANSPACGTTAVQNGGADWQSKDADCYSNPIDAIDWEYQHIYEIQLAGSLFDSDDLTEITQAVTDINVHASDPKRGGHHEFVFAECLTGDISCDPLTAVPIPAAAWLFGSGMLGLIGLRSRKRRSGTA
ncbi:MAG: VPLPA-CTERM sorting domain-containing protein [Porticoccaceae bacterium]|nr:VPLPA-CTERM sorting domain-containing protein [Porticoccaceae bacterium]